MVETKKILKLLTNYLNDYYVKDGEGTHTQYCI